MDPDNKLARQVKLRGLRALIAVAREGNIARAADRLALSQPAVSKTIAELERVVGARLLSRSNRGVELTLSGEALVRRATNMLDELRVAAEEIAHHSDATVGEVRLTVGAAFAAGFVSRVLLDLAREFPRIRPVMMEHAGVEIALRELRNRNVDLAVQRAPTPRREDEIEDIVFEPLFDERIYMVANRSHPLARRRRVDLRTLENQAWVIPVDGTFIAAFIAAEFDRLGLRIAQPAVRTNSMPLTKALLDTGRFLAMLPGSLLACTDAYREIAILPVDTTGTTRPVGILRLKQRALPPACGPFIACARAAALRMRNDASSRLTFPPGKVTPSRRMKGKG